MNEAEHVYLIGGPDSPLVKIGRSTNVAERLAAIQRMSPVQLTVLWQTEGGAKLEAALHHWFRDRRSHGEWFSFPNCDAPTLVPEAIPQIARKEMEVKRARLRSLRARKARQVWAEPRKRHARKVYPRSRLAGFSVGDVVRVTDGIWAFAETGVVRGLTPGGKYAIEENDGRTHFGYATLDGSKLVSADSVPELPRIEQCVAKGCTCETFD